LYTRKILRNFFFFDDWVLSTLNYHPVSIWSIFNASKALIKSESYSRLREYWSLELIFFDKILANQGFEDIIEISQFVDPAFSLREKCVKTILFAHTP
jgi:hypothetical protein